MTELLDPDTPLIISIWGRKRSGKSVLASRLWRTYPYDRLCIDPAGDADVGPADGPDPVQLLEGDLPRRFPVDELDGRRRSFRYVGDVGSPTYEDDLDRAVGLAFFHPRKRCLLWADEVGDLTRAAKTPPNMKRALHRSRHQGLSMLLCGPRPVDVNRLCVSQADLTYCFDLPIPEDRERIAKTIGYPVDEFHEIMLGLPEHGFVRWDAVNRELVEFPPLPLKPREMTVTDGSQRG